MKTARLIVFLLIGISMTLVGAIVSGSLTASAQEPAQRKKTRNPPEVVEGEMVTRRAVCRWAAEPPVLDGSYWTKTPRAGTFAYLVWDDDALYYAASMADAELRSFGTRRNDTLWDGDVFELFFKPNADKPEYFEFQANPRMLVFEMAFARRGANPPDFKTAPLLGNKAVVVLKGTLDQPGDRDLGWSVEGRIPWSAFATGGGKPSPGDEWLFALCRYDYGPDGTRPVLMSSAPLSKSQFHRYEDYGKLRFEGARKSVR
jgi:Carbohydrate family 9 binding domain-like